MRSWGAVLTTVTQLIFMTQIPAAPRAETILPETIMARKHPYPEIVWEQ